MTVRSLTCRNEYGIYSSYWAKNKLAKASPLIIALDDEKMISSRGRGYRRRNLGRRIIIGGRYPLASFPMSHVVLYCTELKQLPRREAS